MSELWISRKNRVENTLDGAKMAFGGSWTKVGGGCAMVWKKEEENEMKARADMTMRRSAQADESGRSRG